MAAGEEAITDEGVGGAGLAGTCAKPGPNGLYGMHGLLLDMADAGAGGDARWGNKEAAAALWKLRLWSARKAKEICCSRS